MLNKIIILIIRLWIVITLFIMITIIFLSFHNLKQSENIAINNLDKFFHLIMYMFLSIPVSLVKKKPYLYLLSYFFLGVLIEIIQPNFNRFFDLLDIFFNFIGLLFGYLISRLQFNLKN